jgi:hypothetical protein
MSEMKCHICDHETDLECADCEKPVCDEHTTPYTIYTQVDWTQCVRCHDYQQRERQKYG